MNKPKKRFTGDVFTCKRCRQEKPITAFAWDDNRPFPRSTCKECRYARRDLSAENIARAGAKADWRGRNKDRLRQNWERAKYGVCKEEMTAKSCEICGGHKRLSIDHDHKTGLVRGLLCTPCNLGLGGFRDREDLLALAIVYLQRDR